MLVRLLLLAVANTRRFPVAGSCKVQVEGGTLVVWWMILLIWMPAGAAVPAEAALSATATPLKPFVSAVARNSWIYWSCRGLH